MEENNNIFLAGGVLVYLAELMQKKIFHKIILGQSI